MEEVRPDAVGILQELVHHYDDPYADSSAIPTMYLARMTSGHVKVALSGTGGDETLAGYRRYYADRMARRLSGIPGPLLRGVKGISRYLPRSRRTRLGELNLLVGRLLESIDKPADERYLDLVSFIGRADLGRLLKTDGAQFKHYEKFHSVYNSSPRKDAVSRALWLDLQTYLPGDLLVKEDRATMAYGLESRVPFLDTDLVGFTVSLPPEMKLRGMTTKYILRRWAERKLPPFVLKRKKHGFGVPLSEWLREDLKEYAHDILLTRTNRCQEFVDLDVLKELWTEHQNGEDHGSLLYSVLILELWLRSISRDTGYG